MSAALEPGLYPHLEQPLPDLCADRIDYALRDALALGKIEKSLDLVTTSREASKTEVY